MQLDVHPASKEERLGAYRNVYDVWPRGRTLEEHVERRLHSLQHNRAQWYVGCIDGRVATSLACYPLAFRCQGTVVPGIAVGSAHTLAAYRGRGFAPRLIAYVEHAQRQSGVKLSMLYSDIDPEYYARLGYVHCPSYAGWINPETSTLRAKSASTRLDRFSIEDHLESVSAMYAAYHGAQPICIERPVEYWRYLSQIRPEDRFFWLVGPGEQRLGYLRIAIAEATWRITDFAISRNSPATLSQLFGSLLRLADRQGVSRVGGWLPDVPEARDWFQLNPRTTEITMLKPLDASLKLNADVITSVTWFCEIDHV